MLRLLLVVILVQCYATASADNATSDEECQKRIPNSYTAVQKNQLCMKIPGRPNPTTIGPAICASVAKQLLHGNVKFETILQLCQGATSAAPIQCYDKMDSVGSSSKTKYGVELCAQAESTLPGECFATVSSYSGTSSKVKPEVLMSFCKVLEDRAPLLCLQAAKDANLVSITQALDMCGEVVGSGSSSSTDSNRLVANCIAQMHSQVQCGSCRLYCKSCIDINHACLIAGRSSLAAASLDRIFSNFARRPIPPSISSSLCPWRMPLTLLLTLNQRPTLRQPIATSNRLRYLHLTL